MHSRSPNLDAGRIPRERSASVADDGRLYAGLLVLLAALILKLLG